MIVDAILCYTDEHLPYLQTCMESLHQQVRQFLIVNNGESLGGRWERQYNYTQLMSHPPRSVSHSFNYGAFHSNADWFLYVDPHTQFFPDSIQRMQELAAVEDYDYVLGRGWVSFLDPESPWGKLLANSDLQENVPLTFLMHRDLWAHLGGIPETLYCHMDVLARELVTRGIVYGALDKMCHHHVSGDFWDVVKYYWRNGFSYTRAGLAFQEQTYTARHLAQLLSALFSAAQQLGVIEAKGLPNEALAVREFMLEWGADE